MGPMDMGRWDTADTAARGDTGPGTAQAVAMEEVMVAVVVTAAAVAAVMDGTTRMGGARVV